MIYYEKSVSVISCYLEYRYCLEHDFSTIFVSVSDSLYTLRKKFLREENFVNFANFG